MKILNKKLLRDIQKAKGQAIAICAVIVCGIAGFSCILSAFRNLKLTRDTYYKEYNFADFTIMMENAPVSVLFKIKSLPGVTNAQGRIVKDVNLDIPDSDEPKIGRIISLSERQEGQINNIYLKSGRFFSEEAIDEVIINDIFVNKNGLRIGDKIYASINNKKQHLKIIGTALSPEYVYMIRNSQEFIPSPERFAVLWVKEDFAEMVFDMAEACNEIIGLAESESELDNIIDRAKKILDPYGYFTTIKRRDQLSNSYLSGEIDGLAVSARIWPVIFLSVAAVILMIMLNRMVKRERTDIGLLKAYGYSNFLVSLHYMKFALIISIAGCLLGFLFGQWMGRWMINMYVKFFQFPILKFKLYPDILFISLVIGGVFSFLGAMTAVIRVIKISPAEAMRPEPPTVFNKILLEKVQVFWLKLSFTWKVIIRNVFRYKFRSAVTIFGVTISTALLLIGYFSGDSMKYLLDHNFKEVQREDIKISLEKERSRDALLDIQRFPDVIDAEPLFEYPFTISSDWRKKDIIITGIQRNSSMLNLVETNNKKVDIGEEGLILFDKAAKELGLSVGDRVTIKPLLGKISKEESVKVKNIVTQYLGIGAYMNINALSRLMDEPFVMNAALLKVVEGKEISLNKALKDVPSISTVVLKSDTVRSVEETLSESMGIMNFINILFAGVIALAVIYNATSISIIERNRELASLRVLGFTLYEVGAIVFNENYLLSIIGLIMGLPIGYFLCKLLVGVYETDLYRLPFKLRIRSYIVTCAVILIFVFIANKVSKRKIRSLDMVEALKSKE